MKDYIDQINGALSCKLYYSALFMTIAIPDICSALQSENNNSDSEKYKNWINKYISDLAPNKYGQKGQLTAEHLWSIRCSLFHQGITTDKKDFNRLLFLEPGTEGYKSLQSIHCCIVGSDTNDKSLLIDIARLCDDMIKGFELWEKDQQSNKFYVKNCKKIIKRYPNGISPIFGTPVIG